MLRLEGFVKFAIVFVTHRPDNVGHVGDAGARGGAEVEDLAAGRHVDVVDAAEHARRKLRPEGVPHPVLCLLSRRLK